MGMAELRDGWRDFGTYPVVSRHCIPGVQITTTYDKGSPRSHRYKGSVVFLAVYAIPYMLIAGFVCFLISAFAGPLAAIILSKALGITIDAALGYVFCRATLIILVFPIYVAAFKMGLVEQMKMQATKEVGDNFVIGPPSVISLLLK